MLEYYGNEVKKTVDKITQIPDIRFSFVYATDMHADYAQERDGVMRQCEAMVEIANRAHVDCVILGGDLLHGVSSKEDSIEYLRVYTEIFQKAKVPTYVTRGNHDDNGYHNDPWVPPYDNRRVPHRYIVWDYEWNREILEPLARGRAVHDGENPESTYYYADYPEKKIRVVFLDAYAYPKEKKGDLSVWAAESWDRFSDRQLQWFAQTALDASKEGWTCILSSHGSLVPGFVTGPCANAAIPLEMIKAFNARGKYANHALGIEADYTNAQSKMKLHIFGHTHRDGYHYDEDAGLLMLNTGNCKVGEYDCSSAAAQYCASPKRERDSINEALFDVIVYTENGTIHRIRFGAGEDQQFQI